MKKTNNSSISIHAPTWGATQRAAFALSCIQISIHAPTWGATRNDHNEQREGLFQSTHPRGVRPDKGGYQNTQW